MKRNDPALENVEKLLTQTVKFYLVEFSEGLFTAFGTKLKANERWIKIYG